MIGRILAIALATLCLFTIAANAEWQRTVWLADTLTPDQGKFQTELWGSYGKADNGDYTDMAFSPLLYYGVMDNLSVEGRVDYWGYDVDGGDSENGLGDMSLKARFRFLDEAKSAIDLAAFGYVWLPTGDDDKGLGTGTFEPGAGLSAAKTFGPVVAIAEVSCNAIIDSDEGEEDGQLYGGIEGAYILSDQLNINVFIDRATSRWKDTDDPSYAGFGARFLPQDQWELLANWAYGLTDSAYDWTASMAVGYEF